MSKDIWLAVFAMAVYVLGGVAVFAGVGMMIFMEGRDVWGLGEGRGLGYLFLAVGLCFTILGVLLMRIFRNR